MPKNVKNLIKAVCRVFGLDIRRVNPVDDNYAWLTKHNIACVLDIGANVGQFAQMIHKVLPAAAILSFEPIEKCYLSLMTNMRKVPTFRAFNYALGETDSEMEMHVNDYTASSSLLPMADLHVHAYPYTAKTHLERIRIRRLDTIAGDLNLDGNLLIKIDVQGYEDKVIRGGHTVILQSKVLIVETTFERLYDDQPLFKNIFELLSNMGFRYMGNLSQMRSPLDGGILQADAIFIRQENQ